MRWNVFHNSKSVFMWLSICGFGMIIDTYPLLSEALGSCHPKLDLGTRWEHPQAINVAAYYWIPNQVWDDGICERLTWKRMYILWHNVIQHCGWAVLIFITHPFMNLELRNEIRRKPIMNYALWIVHYALYKVRACVCVWRVLNHLNSFYGEKRRFTVKNQRFTVEKRRFSMRKAAVFNQ